MILAPVWEKECPQLGRLLSKDRHLTRVAVKRGGLIKALGR